jgi:aminoglycoside phosphotransferase
VPDPLALIATRDLFVARRAEASMMAHHVSHPTHPDIASLVAELLGVTPIDVRGTESPDAFFVGLNDRCVVAKLPHYYGRPGSALVEAWAYRELRRRNIRTPQVLAITEQPECLIVERLAGTPLTCRASHLPPADRSAWARAGEDLRAIHDIRLPGFGPLVLEGPKPRGEAATWCPFADYARTVGIAWLVDAGYLQPKDGDTLIRRFDEATTTFSAISEGRLLHGDLQSGHILSTSDGTYQGIIDFGQAQAGDPRWDLARVRLWDGDKALDALLDGYGHDTLSAADRRTLLPLYLLAFAVHHAVGHDRPNYIRLLLSKSRYETLL